jgi:hypothetical protein
MLPTTSPQPSSRRANVPNLDTYIYSQQGSSTPPPRIAINRKQYRKIREDVFYRHINPHTHWVRPRTENWFLKQDREIRARRGRKDNLGQAAQRLRQRLKEEDPDEWENELPLRVSNNVAWLEAMRYHRKKVRGIRANVASPSPHKRTVNR